MTNLLRDHHTTVAAVLKKGPLNGQKYRERLTSSSSTTYDRCTQTIQ